MSWILDKDRGRRLARQQGARSWVGVGHRRISVEGYCIGCTVGIHRLVLVHAITGLHLDIFRME
jgi:hypothetical protein